MLSIRIGQTSSTRARYRILFAWYLMLVSSIPAYAGGSPFSWGLNSAGELGDGTFANRSTAVSLSGLPSASQVAAGQSHSIVLKPNGTVWGFGYNQYGQVGNGSNVFNINVPVQVSGLTNVVKIGAGGQASFAIKSNGTVWAWGANLYGEIGDGTYTDRRTPVQVVGLTGAVQVTGGEDHAIALLADGTVWAWGENYYGQLGDGTGIDSPTPVQVSGLTGVVQIATRGYNCIALKSDGTVWAWGSCLFGGGLGDGSTQASASPIQVAGLTNVVKISAGVDTGYALKSDGTVWSWGWNVYGQLGDGTFTDRQVPVAVSGLTGVSDIGSAYTHCMAIKSTGVVYAWGINTYGGIGDGTSGNGINYNKHPNPVQVIGLTGIVQVTGGAYHSLALTGSSQANLLLTYHTLTSRYFENKPLESILKDLSTGQAISGATITYTLDGLTLGTATTNTNGRATYSQYIDPGLTLGNHALVASFAGDGNYGASSDTGTLSVDKAYTAISVANRSGVLGQTISLTAQLQRPYDGANVAGKTLTFSVLGTTLGTAVTNSGGVASLSYTIDAPAIGGTNNLDVSFAGDSLYLASNRTGTLTVNPVTTALSVSNTFGHLGETIQLRAQLERTWDHAKLPGKTVAFSVDGNFVGNAITDSQGRAILNYVVEEPLSVDSPVGPSHHTITANFAGDAAYNASTRNGNLRVMQANSYVGQINTYSHQGQVCTLQAKLIRTTDNHVLAGRTIRFFVDGTEVGNAVTNSLGYAYFSYTTLQGSGTYPLKAVFDGDANYIGSQFTGASLIVQ